MSRRGVTVGAMSLAVGVGFHCRRVGRVVGLGTNRGSGRCRELDEAAVACDD